jgi:hypothetical protein
MFRPTVLLIGILAVVPPAPSQASVFVEVDSVELTDLEPLLTEGKLGRLQALTGETLLVTAPLTNDPDDSGTQDGAVYVFAVQPDGTLTHQQSIEPSGRNAFGWTLAADGDWAAIGENQATVHLYQRTGSTWNPTQLLELDDVPATPGITVRNLNSFLAMDGDLLAIGNTNANVTVGEDTIINAGAVVLFRRGLNSVWSYEATLISSEPVGTAEFGDAVAVSGNTLLVGADNDLDGADRNGRAHLFQRAAGQWAQVAALAIPDGEGADFGWSVALDGDVAIVGCATCNITDDGPSNAGSFFAYERNLGGSNNWGLRGEFVGSEPAFIDQFSSSLRIRGDALLVGSPGNAVNRAHFFRRTSNGDWQEAFVLQSTDGNGTLFGGSVEFVRGRATIGAEFFPNTSGSERWGAVHSWFNAGVESCNGNLDAIFCDGYELLE